MTEPDTTDETTPAEVAAEDGTEPEAGDEADAAEPEAPAED